MRRFEPSTGFVAHRDGWSDERLTHEVYGPDGALSGQFHTSKNAYFSIFVENLEGIGAFDVNSVVERFRLTDQKGRLSTASVKGAPPRVITSSIKGQPRIEALSLTIGFRLHGPDVTRITLDFLTDDRPPRVSWTWPDGSHVRLSKDSDAGR